jgi:hypothetical protein
MSSKSTESRTDMSVRALLRKMQSCTGEIHIFPQYTEIDGRRFIDLNDYEED